MAETPVDQNQAPDVQADTPASTAPATPPIVGSPGAAPTPAAPQKESFLQGLARGTAGEQYVVDAQGNVVNARTTAPSVKGQFGSILAGAVVGALAGMSKSRPGGIPSHELGTSNEAGVAGQNAIIARDTRNRAIAQQNFENRNTATEAKNKDLMYRAQLHMADLTAIKLQHEIDESAANDPLRHEQLVNAATLGELETEEKAKQLGFVPGNTYRDYIDVPKADQDALHRNEVKILPTKDGVRVWHRTFDARTTPNTEDFEIKDLVGLDPKTGKPEWKVTAHVKAGSGTAADLEAELNKEHTQLMAAGENNAKVAKDKAEANKSNAEANLLNKQAQNMGLGTIVPPNFQPVANAEKMPEAQLRTALTNQGVKLPNNFSALYAAGHYDMDLKDFVAQTRVRGGTAMDRQTAVTFIRNFVNPNYDENQYTALKDLEKEFASTKPGTAGGNLVSFNTAIGHLSQLYDASQALAKNDLTALNYLANQLGVATGKSPLPVFNSIRAVLAGEAGRLFKQAAPDVQEMQEINASLSSSSSPEQFKGAIQTYAHAFLTKGVNQLQHYYDYTGKLPPSGFSGATKATLGKLGIDANALLGEVTGNTPPPNTANQPPAGSTVVTDKSGTPIGYRLPNTPAGQMIPLQQQPLATPPPQGQ